MLSCWVLVVGDGRARLRFVGVFSVSSSLKVFSGSLFDHTLSFRLWLSGRFMVLRASSRLELASCSIFR